MVDPTAAGFVEIYKHYRRGHLPYAGGSLDQPEVLMRVMDIISALVEAKKD